MHLQRNKVLNIEKHYEKLLIINSFIQHDDNLGNDSKKTAFLTTGSTRSNHTALSIFSLFLLEKQNSYKF